MKRLALAVLLGCLVFIPVGSAQLDRPPAKFVPKFEVVAETRLLMEGLANSNYRSLHKLLKDRPADLDTWVFARGQAILLAETGNLLLLRPPRNSGRDTWMRLAMDMRTQASRLARAVAARDHAGSKQELSRLTDRCNACHTTFKVPARVGPPRDPDERDAE